MTPEIEARYQLILKIVKRAQAMGIAQFGQFTQFMDIDAAYTHFKIRLEDMLAASDFDFAHDFIGIQNSIDREAERFPEGFVPRFADITAM